MKRGSILAYLTGLLLLIGLGCSPKVTDQTSTSTNNEPEPPKEAGPCSTWFETGHQDEAETEHVLYRDLIRKEEFVEALPHWRKVFAWAPMADGQRSIQFDDGIAIYDFMFQQATSDAQKKLYLDSVMYIYDHLGQCEPKAQIEGRKAFDYYYKYRAMTDDYTIYQLFKQAVDKYGLKTDYYVLNPFTALILQMYVEDRISMAEAQKYSQKVKAILAEGLANCKDDKACEPWKIIESYAPVRLEEFEGVEGFYDCAYYMDKYYQEYLDNPQDCDVIRTVLARFRWGGCDPEDPKVKELLGALQVNCVVTTETGPLRQGFDALQNGKYKDAIDQFLEFVKNSDDPEKKAKYLLVVAKIYYGNLRNFPQARKYALDAAALKDDWGDPYMLIGKLYASSGPLCGPGRGFDSQRVVWAAIDKFEYAKKIDPSVAAEANKLIGEYTQYMPTNGDLHMMNMHEGDRYTVPCWINEVTRIRGVRGE